MPKCHQIKVSLISPVVVSNKDNNKFLPGFIYQYGAIVEIANVEKLSEDISFISRSFSLEQIKIFVYRLGYSSRTDWFHAGSGYKSSLLYRFNENI
ncbi:hypothetical protein C1645_837896 [Glomus cerebriforme]|uniref:Uncharacterized protein n=1 Tax=Glomus cerebriforme TaxID=658196 RepID=A0A397SEP4_9GLOM|nr:hypothetical protein C1645_837896 [Glomus cerebriforme]